MSAISSRALVGDARVQRTRAAVFEAATVLFLRNGYAGTTIEDIAAEAGVARRSVYNNFRDKDTLFTEIVAEAIGYAEGFASSLPGELGARITATGTARALRELGVRLAVAILRSPVIALRRLLISEAQTFPGLAREYFDRAPGRVIRTLAATFAELARRGQLRVPDPRLAAEQFAYLVVGAALDRAILVGKIPARRMIVAAAEAGVRTFLASYGTETANRSRRRSNDGSP